jgi:alpha-L-arabinofuranosidase
MTNGVILVSLVNVDPHQDSELDIEFRGQVVKGFTGRILTAGELDAHNTFDNPDAVKPAPFTTGKLFNNVLRTIIPAKSVVVLEINQKKISLH